jgi:Amt family ammonium transporter
MKIDNFRKWYKKGFCMRLLFMSLFVLSSLYADDNSINSIDLVWVMVATALVFLMQAGFTALETGMVRAKNSINVAIKNIADMIIAIAIFFAIGFAFMFGDSAGGFVGVSHFFLNDIVDANGYSFFIFQAVFAGTAVTIVSGAVAERMRFGAYFIVAIVITAFIYPLFGHWTWGGAFVEGQSSWLGDKGFLDFAGSTVVHSIGAWVGLAGAIVLGPRLDRYNEDGSINEIHGSNLSIVAIGVFIIWFGWFGFNGGSTLSADASVAKIIVNTNISAAFAAITAVVLSVIQYGKVAVDKVMFSIIAGLVGITAGCDLVSPLGAMSIGIVSAIVMWLGEVVLEKLRIDDPLMAVPAHGFAGAWGTLAIAFFAPEEALVNGSMIDQFLVQLMGVAVAFVWAFGIGMVLFLLLKSMNILRVPPEDEKLGLNISEHDAKMGWTDTIETMRTIIAKNDFSQRCEIEIGTEAGEVARNFNILIQHIEDKIKSDENCIEELERVLSAIKNGDLSTRLNLSTKNESLIKLNSVINEMLEVLNDKVARSLRVLKSYTNDNYKDRIVKLDDLTGEVRELMDCINGLGDTLSQMSLNRLKSSVVFEENSTKLTRNVEQMKSSADVQTESISKTVVSLEQILADIKDNSERTSQMASLAKDVEKSTQIGDKLAKETTSAMEDINEANTLINESIEMIEKIAFQTKILSLNAAVEAATAGEAGKGFAVVAGEVGNLASSSGEAAKKIKDLVTSAKAKTAEGKEISNRMKDGFENLSTQILQTSKYIEEVSKSSQSQKIGVDTINKAMLELEDVIKDSSKIANETNEVAQNSATITERILSDVKNKEFDGKEEYLNRLSA